MNFKTYRQRLAVCAATIFVMTAEASAHEKWFHETSGYPLRWDLFFRPLPLAFVAAVLLATLAGWLFWKRRGRGFVPGPENFGTTNDRRAALYGLLPAILAVHIAVPLLVGGVTGKLFSPNNELHGVWVYLFGLAQTGIALSFFYGGLTRLAAVACRLVACWHLPRWS